MSDRPSIVALIPARSASKRVPDKNVRPLAGHPLLAYTIAAAEASGVFDAIVVSTDSERYADVARHYGAEVPFLRAPAHAGDTSPDIDWVAATLARLSEAGRAFDCFSILRPTSPFRTADTIRRAWDAFRADPHADSLRAVEPCGQHPGKMWVLRGSRMHPLLPLSGDGPPWHSRQYADLPLVHVQNASLEIARSRVVFDGGTIAGETVRPFLTEGHEGFDVNTPYDWRLAETLVADGTATLPAVSRPAYAERSPAPR